MVNSSNVNNRLMVNKSNETIDMLHVINNIYY